MSEADYTGAKRGWQRRTYLCGGINGLSDADCRDWREIAKSLLITDTLDPMRRDYRGVEHESVDAIVCGDLDDIRHCWYFLINATKPSWGTAMEIAYGRMWGKQMVAFVGDAYGHESPWLRYHCVIKATVEEAAEHINMLCRTRTKVMREPYL